MDRRSICALICLLSTSVATADDASQVDFQRDIRPILSENCFQCHGPDAKARKSDLRLDIATKALAHDPPLLVAGQPQKSLLWQKVSSNDPDVRMPPEESNRRLTSAQQDLIRRWSAQGGEFRRHWSLVPPVRRPPPTVPTE